MTYQEGSDGGAALPLQPQRDAEVDGADRRAEQEHILGSDILPHRCLLYTSRVGLGGDAAQRLGVDAGVRVRLDDGVRPVSYTHLDVYKRQP